MRHFLPHLKRYGLLIAVFWIADTVPAHAQSCDCTEIVGACTGSVTMVPTGAQKGLYGADLTLSANAPQCAKVEYFVDNTPAFTILVNGRSGSDRVMGTSETPMTTDRITYQSCRVCRAGTHDVTKTSAEPPASPAQSEAEMLFDAALDSDTFNPNIKDEVFQRLAAGSSAADAANMAAMMSVMQGMQQLQATKGRSATVTVPATAPPAANAGRKTTDSCTSRGFRTCDFGWPEDVPRK